LNPLGGLRRLPLHIYPDTIIWNLLCDQAVEPKKLLDSLNARGTTLVVSFHTVYELARTFTNDEPKGKARGRDLFNYLKKFLDLNVPCTKELWELIIAEAHAFENNLPEIDPMATPEQCATVKEEVTKLANGVVEGRVKDFLEKRFRFSEDTQEQQKVHIGDREKLNQYLQTISQHKLSEWMLEETFSPPGVKLLYIRLVKTLDPRIKPDYALALIRCPAGEAARGTVRAYLYSNWHCAHYGSNRRDLLDDMLHVLQAMYCDLYVTEDKKQSKYASLLLTPRTRVAIYPNRDIPIDQWLIDLV
jgi:hypothetical protein